MKNILVIITLSGILFSCSSPSNDDTIKEDIKKYRKQIVELEGKIKDLEGQLSDDAKNINTTKVRVLELSQNSFSKFFEATGELEAISEVFISPEVSGQIISINVVEGQKVRKGQVVAKLNTSLIEKNMEEIKTQLNLAKTIFEKQADLWSKGIGSERQYLETQNNYESLQNRLATLQEQYNMSIVKAPINGNIETSYDEDLALYFDDIIFNSAGRKWIHQTE